VRVALEVGGDRVEVAIDDDGRGVGPEDAPRAGEPFRSSWGGTGLGLFVARSFAQSAGGDVTLEAREIGARVRLAMTRVPG
jgi:signal transduction histidine kinase